MLDIPTDQDAIESHLREYLSVLERRRDDQVDPLLRQRLGTVDGNIRVWEQANRIAWRISTYSARIKHAETLIEQVKSGDAPSAKKVLGEFYQQIIDSLLTSGICCLSRTVDNGPMWTHYAQEHRGVCFEFREEPLLFRHSPGILRHEVIYSSLGLINPLQHGYLGTFDCLFKTKALGYSFENEVRCFLFGKSMAVRIPGANLASVILGSRCLHAEGLEGELRMSHMELLR